jgi:hypothetical protein
MCIKNPSVNLYPGPGSSSGPVYPGTRYTRVAGVPVHGRSRVQPGPGSIRVLGAGTGKRYNPNFVLV